MTLNDDQRRTIEVLYMEMNDLLLAYAYKALSDCSLAEEAVQDTFRIACAKTEYLLFSPNPKGWLLNTLKNVINNIVRRRAYLNRIVVISLDLDKDIISGDTDGLNVDFLYSDLVNNEDYIEMMRCGSGMG